MTVFLLALFTATSAAQEAGSGFELRGTFTAGASYSEQLSAAPRNDGPGNAGFRSVLYPVWKINSNWSFGGAWQLYSRPFFQEEFNTIGRGVKGDLLQAHLTYARFWNKASLALRAGQLSPAFGSFLLRYDDAANPVIDMPAAYGYYYKGVSTRGMTGAQADVTLGKVDLRAQFLNSSPANRRSVFDTEQYGSWVAGAGYTVFQGLRIGASAYRGPYLHRQYAYYFPGEAHPRSLTGSAEGLDVQYARGHWNFNGEWQRFRMDYRAIPNFRQNTGYIEARRVLHPRWYVAGRSSYLRASAFPGREVHEFVIGYRPNTRQLIKVGYQVQRGRAFPGSLGNTFTIQLVTSLRLVSIARD